MVIEMAVASFSIGGLPLKALVSAYKEFAASFVLHFKPQEMQANVIAMDRARSMELHLRPYDYRCDGDFWVRADMNMLSKYTGKLKKAETVNVSVRDGKFYVGTIQPGTVIPEVEVYEDEKFPVPKLIEDASLAVVVEDFKRVIKSPSPSFTHIGFDLDEPNGHLIFSNEQSSILDLGPGELHDWLLNLRGKKRVLYDREAFSTLFFPGLSNMVNISLTAQDVAIVKYDEDQYTVRFYIAPKTEGAQRISEVLAKPRPVRTEIFVMGEPEVKLLLSTVKAISQANPHGDVSITPLKTLNLYWGTQRWQGILRISPSHLERYNVPNPVAGLFYAKDLTTFLKELQTLRLYVEYLPAERKMSLVGVGPKVAPKELVADQTIDGRFLPDVKGTAIFTGPVDLLKRTIEDAEISEDEFLVFYTTPYEINAFGRNAVYYSATFETDSFKVAEENHVSIIRDRFRILAGFFGHVPAAEASIGKSQDRLSDVYVSCETSLGPLAFTVSQEEYEIEAAESAYKIERERAAAPKVEKLPAAPAEIPRLIEPGRPPEVEVSSVSSGPFRFVLLNDGEIRVSSMGRFLTREELEKRPEVLAEAIGHFKMMLQTHGLPVPEVPAAPPAVPPAAPPTAPPVPPEDLAALKRDVEAQGTEYKALTDDFVKLEAEFFKVEAKPERGAIDALQRGFLGLPARATGLRQRYDNLRARASKLFDRAVQIPVEAERLEVMRDLDRIRRAEIDVNVKNIDHYGQRSAYMLNQLTEIRKRLEAKPAAPPEERPPRPPPPTRLTSEEVEELWQEFVAYASQQGIPEPLTYRDRFIETIRTAERMEQARERARRLVTAILRELGAVIRGPPVAPGVVPGEPELEEVYKRLRLPPGTKISEMVFQTVWYQIQKERGLLVPEGLTNEELGYLWREFSDFLRRFDVEPERFRDAFNQVVEAGLSVADNLNRVMARAKEITDSGRWGPERWR